MTAYEWRGAGRVLSADETAESRKRVRGFWFHCDSARGTPVARYLAGRGLPWLAGHQDIRYRAETPHPSGARLPAMVVLIHDQHGDIAAVHRTYLTLEGRKADVDPVKATLGAFSGGAIRLDPPGPEMVIAEGLETAASAGFMLGLPAWAAIACGNLRASLVLPPIVRQVTIAADHDPPGQKAAAAAARRWAAEGRTVRIVQCDRPGQDFNDLLRESAHGQ
jgi:phage/plasmid primase-like uncharacterized protein